MKLTDGRKTVEIKMEVFVPGRGYVRPDWSEDFFNAGSLPLDEETGIYTVPDVDYCVMQAEAWEVEECEEPGGENCITLEFLQ